MKKAWGIAAGLMVAVLALSACGGGAAVPPAKTSVRLARTGQVISYATGSIGDDGALQVGVAWPIPRFTVTSSGTGTVVTDNLTGLMWAGDGSTPNFTTCTGSAMTWQGALDYVACLNNNNYLNHTDWRLPNRNELKSIINYGEAHNATWLNTQGFTKARADYYWSSTAVPSGGAWYVFMEDGGVYETDNTSVYYVWPVRSGSSLAPAALPKTGQTACYDISGNVITCAGTGQDGDLLKSVAWPSPRFTTNADTTVTDNLTGLVWARDAGTPTVGACMGGMRTWQQALDYVACLNSDIPIGGHNDWRLPNVNELESLVHAGYSEETCGGSTCATNATWLNTQGFTNVLASQYYWSSTTYAGDTSYAWSVYMSDGSVVSSYVPKTFGGYYVWPVRSGQ